jgi:hypothetical protein
VPAATAARLSVKRVDAAPEPDDVGGDPHVAEANDGVDRPEALLGEARRSTAVAALLAVGDEDDVALARRVGVIDEAFRQKRVEGLRGRGPVARVGRVVARNGGEERVGGVAAHRQRDRARVARVCAIDGGIDGDAEVDALRVPGRERCDRLARGAPLRVPAREQARPRRRHRRRAVDDDHHLRRLAALGTRDGGKGGRPREGGKERDDGRPEKGNDRHGGRCVCSAHANTSTRIFPPNPSHSAGFGQTGGRRLESPSRSIVPRFRAVAHVDPPTLGFVHSRSNVVCEQRFALNPEQPRTTA